MASMLIFIARFFPVKAGLLAILLFLCDKRPVIAKPVKVLCAFLCFSTIWGIIVGCLKGTEEPFQYFFLGMVWPIMSLFILTPMLRTENDFKNLFHYLFYIHAFLILYDIGFALSLIFSFPFYNLYPEVEIGFSFYGTSSRMNFANLNVLTYTIPIYFLIFLSKYDIGIKRFPQMVIVLISFVFSGLFTWLPVTKTLSASMRTIILTIVIAGAAAVLFPVKDETQEGDKNDAA